MPYRLRLLSLVALVLGAVASLALFASSRPPHSPLPVTPPTQRVLVGAPDPSGPVLRDRFVDDPRGQIERLAAGDHLVAWSVRTPADRLRTTNEDLDRESPLQFPERSQLVIVDERGGGPLVIELGRRFVRGLAFLHGAAGELQLVVIHCGSRKATSCTEELLTLSSSAPAKLDQRITGSSAELAATGRIDRGRRLFVGRRAPGACLPTLAAGSLNGTARHTLPPIPTGDDEPYATCTGLISAELRDHYALATIAGKDPKEDFDGQMVYALDIRSGAATRWHLVGIPYRYSAYSGALQLGPAVAGGAIFWSELDFESGRSTPYDLERVPLPTGGRGTAGKPVSLATDDACAIAATEDAVYELDNARCVATEGYSSTKPGGAIRRLSGKGLGLTTPPADG